MSGRASTKECVGRAEREAAAVRKSVSGLADADLVALDLGLMGLTAELAGAALTATVLHLVQAAVENELSVRVVTGNRKLKKG